MKVIGINGSPRKRKNSAIMLEHAINGARSAGADTEIIHLADLQYSGCQSCFLCKKYDSRWFGKCAVQDDLTPVLEKILSADAVIFSMPVYFGNVPGMVLNLFERLWFPALLYRKDGALAYKKRVKVGLIYTMNAPDEQLYHQLIADHRSRFQWFLGETQTLCATDTLQFSDYSLYASEMFDPIHKKAHHETVFPQDCEKAYALGIKLAD